MDDIAAKPEAGDSSDMGRRAEVDLSLVLALTERVEAAIGAGDWQHAAELEAERRAALVALLERSRDASGISAELRAPLARIATRTHRLIGEADHHRRTLLREASMIRIGRKAADEYERNSRT